ncbi:MAG TPA: four helix bundle protein [Chitinophagaceae bacterium]|nr:four helix bundle protein [Chitinophagaceae bacterium]MCB9055751.1 four helix bundle protein [Chitinophagales bacterium]HPG10576.1 four helix bundle protein [Chitinophagaceae bacterium]HRX94240.1 four helix bundle protein [Chitinophagaceae bacterium]
MPKENILKQKSFDFAIKIINLYKQLKKDSNEFVLSRQIVASGTSIGALVREAEHAESLKDFVHKLSIALKEANECKYWLDLLVATGFINKELYVSLNNDCEELLKLLIASVKTTKARLTK